MSLDDTLTDTVHAAVTAALDNHLPVLAHTATDTAVILGISEANVRRLIAAGHLDRLPDTGRHVHISTVSILRYANWPVETAVFERPLVAVADRVAS